MGLCLVVAKASESLLLLHHCSPFCCHNNWLLIARRHAIHHWTAAYASKGDSRIPSLWPGLPARHWLLFHVWFGSLHTHLLSLQLCPTLGNTMDCSPPGSSVHKILQARILEWVACPPPRIFMTHALNPHLLLLCWQAGPGYCKQCCKTQDHF